MLKAHTVKHHTWAVLHTFSLPPPCVFIPLVGKGIIYLCCTLKFIWVPKNWCFWTVVLKTLESPLDSKEIKAVNPKGNHPEYSLEGLMLKLKLQYFGHLLWRVNSLEKTLMLGKIEGKRRRGWWRMRQLDSITNSRDINLSKLQEIVKYKGAWYATVHGVAKSQTRLSNWTTQIYSLQSYT